MKTAQLLIPILTAGLAFGSASESPLVDLQKPDRTGTQDAGKGGDATDAARKGQVRDVKGGKAKRVEGVTDKGQPDAAGQGKPGARDAERVKEARAKDQARKEAAKKDAARTDAARAKDAEGKPAGKGFDRNAVALFGKEVRKHRVVQARLDRLAALFAEEGKEDGVARVAALRLKEETRYARVIARFESMLGADQFATIRARLETGGTAGRGRSAAKDKGKTRSTGKDSDADRKGEEKDADR